MLRFADNPRGRVRRLSRRCSSSPASAPPTRGRLVAALAQPTIRSRSCLRFVPTPALAPALVGVSPRCSPPAHAGSPWPGELGAVARWYLPHARAPARRRAPRAARHRPPRAAGRGLSVARALPHRAGARSAGGDQRRGRPPAARRGLPDPLDDPFRQGPGVERGLGAQRRRRLHPVRHGDRQRRRDRGGARVCSTSR